VDTLVADAVNKNFLNKFVRSIRRLFFGGQLSPLVIPRYVSACMCACQGERCGIFRFFAVVG